MSVRLQGKPARLGTARYEIIQDPTDRFIVWDDSAECPALLGGEIISCDTFFDAQRAVERLSATRPGLADAGAAMLQAANAPSSSRQ